MTISEIHFGSRVHMLLICFSKFKKYENTLKKSKTIWAKTYARFNIRTKISEANDTLCGLYKKDKICGRNEI